MEVEDDDASSEISNFKSKFGVLLSEFSGSEWVTLTRSMDPYVEAHNSPFVVGPYWDNLIKRCRGEPNFIFSTFLGNTCRQKGDGATAKRKGRASMPLGISNLDIDTCPISSSQRHSWPSKPSKRLGMLRAKRWRQNPFFPSCCHSSCPSTTMMVDFVRAILSDVEVSPASRSRLFRAMELQQIDKLGFPCLWVFPIET